MDSEAGMDMGSKLTTKGSGKDRVSTRTMEDRRRQGQQADYGREAGGGGAAHRQLRADRRGRGSKLIMKGGREQHL